MERLSLIRNHLAESQAYTKIETEVFSDNVGIIYLNSPKDLNALTSAMKKELSQAIRNFDSSTTIRVIILASKVEKGFCAGADLKELQNTSAQKQKEHDIFQEISDTMENCRTPIIGAINGFALGGGFEVALKCDILIAATNTKFMFPEVKLGLLPGIGGTQRAARILGRSLTSKLVLAGEPLTAKQALAHGLCTDVVEPGELLNKAKQIALSIAERPKTALKSAKECIRASEELSLTEGNKFERNLFNLLLDEKCSKEGIGAFLNKRKPDFKNL